MHRCVQRVGIRPVCEQGHAAATEFGAVDFSGSTCIERGDEFVFEFVHPLPLSVRAKVTRQPKVDEHSLLL